MFTPRPSAAQFLVGPTNLSFATLNEQIAHVAHYLLVRQLAGTQVLLMVREDHDFAPLVLGCMRAGVVPLILDARTVSAQVAAILELTEVAGVIADAALIDGWRAEGLALPEHQLRVSPAARKGQLLRKLMGRHAQVDLASWPGLLDGPTPPPAPQPAMDGIAYVIFTSGSTARPKGVEMSWSAMLCHLDTLTRHYALGPEARIMNLMPLSHADGLVHGVLLCYRSGISMVRPSEFSIGQIESLLIALYRERISHLVAAPTALALMTQYGGHLAENFANNAFRFVISCSAPLSEAVWSDFSARFGVPVVNTYGLSETGTCALYAGPDAASHKIGSVGMPRDMDAKIVKADLSLALDMEEGELCLRGPNLMRGYLNDPVSTAQVLRDGWLHTGDLARRDADGVYYIVGRIKSLIVCGGYNLSPDAINAVLLGHPAVLEAATVGIADPIWGEIPIACVVLCPDAQADSASLLAHCRQHLSEQELPKKVQFVASLPRNRAGKVVEASLRASLTAGSVQRAASGDVREAVLRLASEIFTVPLAQLGAQSGPSNTPGWDSLAHINFVVGLEAAFGIRLSPSDVVSMDTLDATVDLVRRHAR